MPTLFEFEGGLGVVASASSERPATQPPPPPPPVAVPVDVGDGPPPPIESSPSTFTSALAQWLEPQALFRSTFIGGLWYDVAAADPRVVYPFVVFARHDSKPTGVAGRPFWSEVVEVIFRIEASGDQDIDDLADTLESILFSPRGGGQAPIEFPRGRIVHRRGGVKSIGITKAMGVAGVDVFQATIESKWLVARDS